MQDICVTESGFRIVFNGTCLAMRRDDFPVGRRGKEGWLLLKE